MPTTRRYRRGAFLSAVILCGLLPLGTASGSVSPVQGKHQFHIDAPQLSSALIQISRQSRISIVFADNALRGLPVEALAGTYSVDDALNTLLAGSGLRWELVDNSVIAVFPQKCNLSTECPGPDALLDSYPVFVPGIEETYVYGTRVTGSRIRRTNYTGSGPVEILTRTDIELSGVQSIGELLKFVPAVVGNSTSTAIANGGDGTATVTLRGLPSNNTLVLVNGKRVANDGLAGDSVDLNSIPPSAVERVEILKDGASAIYGSDAIAGVVNIILKRDFHGFLVEGFYGATDRGDLETTTQTLQYGNTFERGSVFINASRFQQEPIFSRDRNISASADTRPLGGTDQRSSATPDARTLLPDGRTLIATPDGYREATDDDLFNFQQYTTAVVPFERTSLYANGSYDFSDSISGLVEFTYMDTDADAVLAPTPIFTAFQQDPLVVAADNPYNPFGVTLTDVRRRLLELPERRQQNDSEVMRAGLGLEGLWADWYWDTGFDWSRSEATERSTSIVNADRLRRAIGPSAGCLGPPLDDCVAVNITGPAGSLTPEQVQYIVANGEVSGYYELSTLSLTVGRSLPAFTAGHADLAMGVEHRRESTRKLPDDLLASTSVIGATNFEPTSGKRQITELYLELLLPLWKSASGESSVDLQSALRFSHYSDFGASTNPGVTLRWQTGPALALRASFATGFRAPSLNELYEGVTENQAFLNDPCALPANVGVLPGCTVQSDPSLNQFLTLEGGNPGLEPETSRSWGIGLVWTPPQFPGITASADLFRIDQRDVVSASAQYVVSQNARNGSFSDRIERDTMGNLVLIRADNINIGRRRVTGADFGLDWQYTTSALGQFQVSGSASWIQEYLSQLDASAPELNIAGTFRDEASEGLGGIPQWKAQLDLRWTRNRWQASYQINYVDSMRELIPDTDRTRRIEGWLVQDIQLNYRFDVLEGLRLTLGIDNLIDTDAPLAVSAFNDNIDGRTHDLKGRFWYTRLSQRF